MPEGSFNMCTYPWSNLADVYFFQKLLNQHTGRPIQNGVRGSHFFFFFQLTGYNEISLIQTLIFNTYKQLAIIQVFKAL